MIVSKSPMRISLFGGSTDYKSFYEKHGAFIIGTTIDKYAYNIIRFRPSIVGTDSIIKYSKLEKVKNIADIQNALIRETLKYYGVDRPVELNFDADAPTRTGLGGSSSYCAALARSVCTLLKLEIDDETLCQDIIKIEREILNEPGGIQDQIWACHGGFKFINIAEDGTYKLYPVYGSKEFYKRVESSMVLIYSRKQRELSNVSTPVEEDTKLKIKEVALKAYSAFFYQDIPMVGKLLYKSWIQKRNLSDAISDENIDNIIDDIMSKGAYGAKLLGNGGAGFILAMCNEKVKKVLKETYQDAVLDFEFSEGGIKTTII